MKDNERLDDNLYVLEAKLKHFQQRLNEMDADMRVRPDEKLEVLSQLAQTSFKIGQLKGEH